MTREIKFRAWTEDYGMMQVSKMVECDDGVMHYFTKASDSGYYDLDNPKNALLQFTCLHDNNGVEIYEGDIVKILGGTLEEGIRVIEYADGGFNVSYTEYITPVSMFVSVFQEFSRIEVIGNIYENPELLEA